MLIKQQTRISLNLVRLGKTHTSNHSTALMRRVPQTKDAKHGPIRSHYLHLEPPRLFTSITMSPKRILALQKALKFIVTGSRCEIVPIWCYWLTNWGQVRVRLSNHQKHHRCISPSVASSVATPLASPQFHLIPKTLCLQVISYVCLHQIALVSFVKALRQL